MTSAETPETACSKGPVSNWKERVGPFVGILFWMTVGAFVFNAIAKQWFAKPPQQGLRITNTGSVPVEIRKLARWSWQEEAMTVHPGGGYLWKFAPGDNFRIARSDEKSAKPGTTPPASPEPSRAELWRSDLHHNADGSATMLVRHVDRTAEVRVNESGKIEFKFTDL